MNRLLDGLVLFEQVCCHPLLDHTAIILFLNKKDLMDRKLESEGQPVSYFFADYKGPNRSKEVCKFFKKKFLSRIKPGKSVYCHITTSTDTKQMRVVTVAVRDTVLRSALQHTGVI